MSSLGAHDLTTPHQSLSAKVSPVALNDMSVRGVINSYKEGQEEGAGISILQRGWATRNSKWKDVFAGGPLRVFHMVMITAPLQEGTIDQDAFPKPIWVQISFLAEWEWHRTRFRTPCLLTEPPRKDDALLSNSLFWDASSAFWLKESALPPDPWNGNYRASI